MCTLFNFAVAGDFAYELNYKRALAFDPDCSSLAAAVGLTVISQVSYFWSFHGRKSLHHSDPSLSSFSSYSHGTGSFAGKREATKMMLVLMILGRDYGSLGNMSSFRFQWLVKFICSLP